MENFVVIFSPCYFRGCSLQVCPREYSLGLSYDSGIFMGVGWGEGGMGRGGWGEAAEWGLIVRFKSPSRLELLI